MEGRMRRSEKLSNGGTWWRLESKEGRGGRETTSMEKEDALNLGKEEGNEGGSVAAQME